MNLHIITFFMIITCRSEEESTEWQKVNTESWILHK